MRRLLTEAGLKPLSCKSPASRLARSLAQGSRLAKMRRSECLCAVCKGVSPHRIRPCPPLCMFRCEERVPVCNSKFWSLCWSWRHFSLSVAETATQNNCLLFYRNRIVETGGSASPDLGHPRDSAFTKREEKTWDVLLRAGLGWSGFTSCRLSPWFLELELTLAVTQL